jgi:hypothetical protein
MESGGAAAALHMGNECICRVDYGARSAETKVLLETEEIIVRGAMKLRLPFREIEHVAARDGVLALRWRGDDVELHVGTQAAKWAEKIRNPKSVIDKIGVREGERVSIVGNIGELAAVVEERSGDVSRRVRKGSDVIFFAAKKREELAKLAKLRASLAPNGALWVIRPKGTAAIGDADVIAAGKAAGLVDVKVVRVSETLTGEKLVIPVTKR